MRYRWLPIAGAVFLVITMTIQFVVAYKWEERRVLEHIDYEMQLAQKDLVFEIYDIQDAGEYMLVNMKRYLNRPDSIISEAVVTLKHTPDILSCYVSFRPWYFHPDEYWYCPCAYRSGDSIITMYYGDENHDYFQKQWYLGALKSDQNGYWSSSYRDEDFVDLICTHSVRVDDKDSLACVIGIDFSLKWLKSLLEDIKPYDDALCLLYGTDGSLILKSSNMGERTTLDGEKMITRSMMLSPMDMRLEIGVPASHVWHSVRNSSLLTLLMLLIGLGVAALLIIKINADQTSLMRAEMANRIMEHELHIASGIQRGILKSGEECRMTNANGDIEVQAALEPMREVGGDLYDFYRHGENLYFIIGDVSGKSVPAAMFMSATVNLFRSAVRRLSSPKAIMEDMNSVLSENNPSMMFVTAFIGRLHIPTGQLLYCNAGHLSPMIVSNSTDNRIRGLDLISNIPMGYDASFLFEEQGTMLRDGDTIVLYTDGITEARNEKREMLGHARWCEIIRRQKGNILCHELQKEITAFMVNTVPTDDITLMVIRKTGAVAPVTILVENKIDQWPVLRAAVHEYGLCVGVGKRPLKKLEIALEEAVVNIINYSQATEIGLRVENLNDERITGLKLTLSDNGIPFDPTAQAYADTEKVVTERQIGGLGITLLKQIADDLQYRRTEDGKNELIIIKNC